MKEIPLSRGLVAVVDDSDFERVAEHRWYANRSRSTQYAYRWDKTARKWESMHRFILGVTGSTQQVDHANRNGLDNRRENLRLCSASQNQQNRAKFKSGDGMTSRYKGVSRCRNRWQSVIKVNAKIVRLGMFKTQVEAAIAYDHAAMRHFGEFAVTNFPRVQYRLSALTLR